MKKCKRNLAVIVSLAFLSFAASVIFAGTGAFLSDKGELFVNQFTVGKLDTSVTEEFHPEDLKKDEEKIISKKACVTNNGIVDSYVRLSVIFSSSDWNARLLNVDTENWSYDGEDDCYYYRKALSPGESTTNLFDGIKIPKEKDTSSLTETEAFQVYLTEESVQAVHGNEMFKDFKEAWNYYTVQRQGDIGEKE